MGHFRQGAFAALSLASFVIAFGASNCASPTQIIVNVQASSALCRGMATGIAVTTRENIDADPLEIYQEGCADGTQVGTLTVTPSGGNDAWIGIRVVAAVGNDSANPDRCGRTDVDGKANWDDCILARRTVRFVAGETVSLTIRLTEDCVGQYCGDDRECNLGQCVKPDQLQPDGGNATEQDAGLDASTDGEPVDAGADACSDCLGTCMPATGDCIVDCDPARCRGKVVCGGSLNCRINCNGADDCERTRCDTTGTCTFDCSSGTTQSRCPGIACRASTCEVACTGAAATCKDVFVDGGANRITCAIGANNQPTCESTSCSGGTCVRTCADGGLGCKLGDNSRCSGNCAAYEDAGDGGR